jgi:hypothetical protein
MIYKQLTFADPNIQHHQKKCLMAHTSLQQKQQILQPELVYSNSSAAQCRRPLRNQESSDMTLSHFSSKIFTASVNSTSGGMLPVDSMVTSEQTHTEGLECCCSGSTALFCSIGYCSLLTYEMVSDTP